MNNSDNPPPDYNKFDNNTEYKAAYERYIAQLQRDVKDICPSCKFIYDKIFEYRLQNMSKLTEECEHLFNLPANEFPVITPKVFKIKLTPSDVDKLIQEKKIVKKYFINTIELEMK